MCSVSASRPRLMRLCSLSGKSTFSVKCIVCRRPSLITTGKSASKHTGGVIKPLAVEIRQVVFFWIVPGVAYLSEHQPLIPDYAMIAQIVQKADYGS